MVAGIGEVLVISILLFLIVVALFVAFRRKQEEPTGTPLGKRIGTWLAFFILLGMGIGLYKLANPPLDRVATIAIPSVTKTPETDENPENVIIQFQSYQKALIIDIWSIRLVFPDRYWFGAFSELHERNTTGTTSWAMTRSIQGTEVSIDWPYSPQNIMVEAPGALSVFVEGALMTIEDGIATIGDLQIPATGNLRVVFFDEFGQVESVTEQLEGDDSVEKK